tara:strand:+ start:639 stop:2516 length:1878 start_codon:yes stop_codon:yes gene_type:complete
MAQLDRDIRYTDRDFNTIRSQLIDYSKTYFPNTFNDFTETSTGMLFIEMAAYVGDVMSFYLDNQIQETFIQKARQTQNLYALAYSLGYVPKVTTVATTFVDYYQQVPSIVSASIYVPDYSYALLIPENTSITANNDSSTKFLTEDVVDFSASSSLDPTTVSVYQITNGNPTYYLLKKSRKATSSEIISTSFTFTNAKKFDSVNINDANIIGILDVFDSNGNQWYEVPNLAQENVYNTIRNTDTNDPNFINDPEVPYLLELKTVQRRFAARFIDSGSLQLQFGAGSTRSTTEEIIPNPDNVGLGLPFEQNKLTTAFSPTNFVFTNTYGIAPYNTTLTVRYLKGGGASANVEAGTLTGVDNTNVTFVNQPIITTPAVTNALANQIFNSLTSNNPLAADGGMDGDTVEELRQNALGNFQNQLRVVTTQDYLVRALSMPSKLGTIAKAHAQPQKIGDYQSGELPSVLDLYILSFNSNKQLRTASVTLKRNLQTYLSEYRMINDSINIKDAYIINIQVNFEIVVNPNYNNSEVLTNCIDSLQAYFDIDKWQINEPIIMKDIFVRLSKIEGVQIVKNIVISNLTGESKGYSNFSYDTTAATIDDVLYPSLDPMVFEVKYPNQDIIGKVVAI